MLFFWFFVISIIATVVIVPWVLIRLPANYFCLNRRRQAPFANFPYAMRLPLILAKNFLGLVLVGLGLMFLLMPGQGVIVILIGVLLLDFPRKKQLEHWLISRGPILKLANWIRRKGHKEPLLLD